MKCPNCGKNLWFVKDVCPFCKQAIASTAESRSATSAPVGSENDPASGEAFVTLTKCGTLGEADALRAQLATAGIEAVIPDETMLQTVAWPMSTYGYVRVQVRSADHLAAKEFVSALKQEPQTNELANLPLSSGMRWLAFFLPLLVCAGWMAFAIARNAYSAQGCERKAEELWHWFAGGFLFWIAAGVITLLARAWLQ